MNTLSNAPVLDGPRLQPLSGNPARHLIVLLHGYGADGADLIDIGRAWQPDFPDAAFVAPNAPEHLPFEAFGARQWFALEERDPKEYRIGAETAQPVLDRFLDAELATLGLEDTALAIFGFSQGAMMAFQCGLRRKLAPAAILAYSGLLPGQDQLDDIGNMAPVLIVHGDDDDVVPAYHLDAAATALGNAGVSVEAHKLPGLGHSIDLRGIDLGRHFLKKYLA